MEYGLIGKSLAHSFSPQLHQTLAGYDYRLFELSLEALPAFLQKRRFSGVNVTIPYKQTVVAYCDELSETARETGAVNTIVNRGGRLYGDNTDCDGLAELARHASIALCGKKLLILGGGGTAKTAMAVARRSGAHATVVSRSGPVTYDMLMQGYADTQVIINTTPVGMFPNNGEAAVDISWFPKLSGVLDTVYNPLSSALVLSAAARGIPAAGGLYMLAAQAKKSAELFTGTVLPDAAIQRAVREILTQRKNIVLVGMPGCGKSTVGKAVAKETGREFIDTDDMLEAMLCEPVCEYLRREGEKAFRSIEMQAVREAGKKTGVVIATGGGAVTRAENYAPLAQNGVLYWLQRDTGALATEGRPLSEHGAAARLYEERQPMYRAFASRAVSNNGSLHDTVRAVLEAFYEDIGD